MSIISLEYPVGLPSFVTSIKALMRQFLDVMPENNCDYTVEDAALAVFAVFYMQSTSFLDHQRTMGVDNGVNNAQTLFGVVQIPDDDHICQLLDPLTPNLVFPLFAQTFDTLNANGHIDPFRVSLIHPLMVPDRLLIALDRCVYYQARSIHDANCTSDEHKNDTIGYKHSVLTPVVVMPEHGHAIALEPEFEVPQDGHSKQDSEIAMARRWLAAYGHHYAPLVVTLLGDDLYSCQTMCEAVLAAGFNMLFVCKPCTHTTLYEWVENFARTSTLSTCQIQRRQGKNVFKDIYRFASELPLCDGDDALRVNWVEITTTDAKDTVRYQNAWITRHVVSAENCAQLVKAARAHGMIKNGNNNILKTKGYNIEHKFGHGKKHLSAILTTFNLLAFLLHTVQELDDHKYQALRNVLSTRKNLIDSIRTLTILQYFDNFDALLNFMLKSFKIDCSNSE